MNEIDSLMEAGHELNRAAVNFAITQMDYEPRPPHETGTALGLQRAAVRYARAVDAVLHRTPKPTMQERLRLIAAKVIPAAVMEHFYDAKPKSDNSDYATAGSHNAIREPKE